MQYQLHSPTALNPGKKHMISICTSLDGHSRGHRGPVLRLRCTRPVKAQTRIQF
jgi:hypothetical protein